MIPAKGGANESAGIEESSWRIFALPALTVIATLAACGVVIALQVQASSGFNTIQGRPERWLLIAGLAGACVASAVARIRIARTFPGLRRGGAVASGFLIATCLAFAIWPGLGATTPCYRGPGVWILVPLGLCLAALIASIVQRAWDVTLACGGIGLVALLAFPMFLGVRHCDSPKAAQSSLRNGLVAARLYYADDDTYTGFSPKEGESIEPALEWVWWTGERASNPTRIQVKVIDSDTILLLAFSPYYGQPFCIVDSPDYLSYGESATGNPADCANPSW